jgi:hypothetical protein
MKFSLRKEAHAQHAASGVSCRAHAGCDFEVAPWIFLFRS